MNNPIACTVCGAEYENYWPITPERQTKQATRCAASAGLTARGEFVVRGHYGSDHDMTEFRAPRPPQGWPTEQASATFVLDPVCDNCIEFARDAGQLVEVGEWNYG